MRKRFLVVALLVCIPAFASALTDPPTKPRLAILPFAGGTGGEGEAMAAMLSSSPAILGAFAVVPLTDEAAAAIAERQLLMSAFADSDALAEIGRILGADYVASGHVRRLGNRSLAVAAVVRVSGLELVAGYSELS